MRCCSWVPLATGSAFVDALVAPTTLRGPLGCRSRTGHWVKAGLPCSAGSFWRRAIDKETSGVRETGRVGRWGVTGGSCDRFMASEFLPDGCIVLRNRGAVSNFDETRTRKREQNGSVLIFGFLGGFN